MQCEEWADGWVGVKNEAQAELSVGLECLKGWVMALRRGDGRAEDLRREAYELLGDRFHELATELLVKCVRRAGQEEAAPPTVAPDHLKDCTELRVRLERKETPVHLAAKVLAQCRNEHGRLFQDRAVGLGLLMHARRCLIVTSCTADPTAACSPRR